MIDAAHLFFHVLRHPLADGQLVAVEEKPDDFFVKAVARHLQGLTEHNAV